VDVRQLTAFVMVADIGSVTRAAGALKLGQSSVTRQIQSLEQELGVALFERTRQGMALTAAGVVMAGRARRALRELGLAQVEIAPTPAAVRGVVAVGLPDGLAELICGPLIAAVPRAHPNIELRVTTGSSGLLRRLAEAGRLDVAVCADAAASACGQTVPLATERLWAAAPRAAGLCAEEPVTLRELARHPLLLPLPGHTVRASVEAAAADAGLALRTVAAVGSHRLRADLAAQGHGWTVLPGFAVLGAAALGERLTAAPLSAPEIRRQLVLRTSPRRGAAVEIVAGLLMRAVCEAVNERRLPAARLVEAVADGAAFSGDAAAISLSYLAIDDPDEFP
jgi:DNA-binding transcriptional LysR family regulator